VRSSSAKEMGLTEEDIDDGINHYDDSERFTDAEKLALRYSDLMASDPDKIDASFYKELKKHYTMEEIVELGSFIGVNIGFHTFFRTLDFYPMFSPDGRLVSQEESRIIYGASPESHEKGAIQRAVESAPDNAIE
jgi:hypothetical protein